VDESQYELCIETLRRLGRAGVLRHLVLIGGWAGLLYREYFGSVQYMPAIRTRDLDLLVPEPRSLQPSVDVAELLKDLGYVTGFTGRAGYIRLEHPELIVEFLVPERGKGTDKPVKLPQLGVNAQALRFLDYLAQERICVNVSGVAVNLPHPAWYALHKLILQQRRSDEAKSLKDRQMALSVIDALVGSGQIGTLGKAFISMPKGWQTKVKKALVGVDESVVRIICGTES
jgi:hypothetical protein